MKEVGGSIDIESPAARVWKALTDFSSYPEWNPFIVRMFGLLKVGSVFEVTVRLPGRKELTFSSQVVNITEGKDLLFRGAPHKGLISDDHLFSLEALDPERTRFTQKIVYSGIVVPLAGGVIRDSQQGVHSMNEAMKARLETRS